MFQTEHLQEKWSPVLAHPDLPKIEDSYKRAVTTLILENQEKSIKRTETFLQKQLQRTLSVVMLLWILSIQFLSHW